MKYMNNLVSLHVSVFIAGRYQTYTSPKTKVCVCVSVFVSSHIKFSILYSYLCFSGET
jgi:hypothetical protein